MDSLKAVFKENLEEDVPLKELTTVGIGGPAKLFLPVKTTGELVNALKLAKEENLPFIFIGGGSNLLVSDEGFPGLVIKNETTGINQENNTLDVFSGTILQDLVNLSIQKGLSRLQKLTGIPGTLGGAIYGNAGAYGQTISDNIIKVRCLDPISGQVIEFTKTDCVFGYRDSIFKRNNCLILSAVFELLPKDPIELEQEATEVLKKRTAKYPHSLRCPGSFFKNVLVKEVSRDSLLLIPKDKITYDKIPAGYLLEAVGAKGQQLGSIGISENHGNLFTNLGEGKAEDFYQLAKDCAQKVKEKFGISLEPEVQLINLPSLNS